MLIILAPGCACALLALFVANTLSPTSARETPARAIKRPIKTRRLKKADFEADFFFIVLVELELHSTLRRPDAPRWVIAFLVSPLIRRQDHSFESMENFRDHEIARIKWIAMN